MIVANKIELNALAPEVRKRTLENLKPLHVKNLTPLHHSLMRLGTTLRRLKFQLSRAFSYLVEANQEAVDLHNRIHSEKERNFAKYGHYIQGIH